MNEELYELLKDGVLGCSTTEYESLATQNGIKKADGVPQGTCLEVYDESTGKIKTYCEAIKGLWYER